MTMQQTERVELRPRFGQPDEEVRFPYWQCDQCAYGTTDPDYAASHARTHPEPIPEPAPEPTPKSKEK